MSVSTVTRKGTGVGQRRKTLLRRWFASQHRQFPWRQYYSPWHVLLAEMLLLRTRAEIVAKRIANVIERFPTPQSMANENPQQVQYALRAFGLRWRAQRLHELACVLVARYGGTVPTEFDELIQLPGVGPYVAGATVSALTGRSILLTDANTVRVATRVAGLKLRGDVRRQRKVQLAISALFAGEARLGDWLAVLDLAASVCLPRNPACARCPIVRLCSYGLDRAGDTH